MVSTILVNLIITEWWRGVETGLLLILLQIPINYTTEKESNFGVNSVQLGTRPPLSTNHQLDFRDGISRTRVTKKVRRDET